MGVLFKPFVFVSSSYLDDAITPFVNACSPEGVGGVDAGGGGCWGGDFVLFKLLVTITFLLWPAVPEDCRCFCLPGGALEEGKFTLLLNINYNLLLFLSILATFDKLTQNWRNCKLVQSFAPSKNLVSISHLLLVSLSFRLLFILLLSFVCLSPGVVVVVVVGARWLGWWWRWPLVVVVKVLVVPLPPDVAAVVVVVVVEWLPPPPLLLLDDSLLIISSWRFFSYSVCFPCCISSLVKLAASSPGSNKWNC